MNVKNGCYLYGKAMIGCLLSLSGLYLVYKGGEQVGIAYGLTAAKAVVPDIVEKIGDAMQKSVTES